MRRLQSKNQKGIALLEVMVASVIGAVVILGVGSMLTNQQLDVNGIKYRSDADNFNEELRALLSSPQACANSFGGRVVGPAMAPINIANLFDGSAAPGVARYTTGNTYGDLSLVLNSMALGNYAAGGAANTAMVTLTSALATAKQASGAQSLSRTVNISIRFDGANRIISCIALSKMSDGIWQRSAANLNNIFFTAPPPPAIGGYVGIGTGTPLFPLHIASDLDANTAVFTRNSSAGANAFTGFYAMNSANGEMGIGIASPNLGPGPMNPYAGVDTQNWALVGAGVGVSGLMFGLTAAAPMVFATSALERMRISANGNIGMGITAPSEKLHVLGNLRVQGSTDCILGNGAGGTNCSSDIRLKTHIQEIENPLDKILALRGVEFDWNEKSQSPGQHAIGVIAQDVQQQFPTAVIEDSSTGYKKVDYAVLVAPIIQAFKDLIKQIQENSNEIAAVKAENAVLRGEISQLKEWICSKDPAAPACK